MGVRVGVEPQGLVAGGFEPVREAFAENFRRRGEVGASVCVVHRGRVVVDLWGGSADPATGRAFERETPVPCFSSTKGLVATCFLMLEDRGLLSLDAPIVERWPEFGRQGKATVTTRQLLNHRAGLSAVDVPLRLSDVRDHPEKVHEALVAQRPAYAPDTAQAYAACTFGLYTQELFRRVTGRSLGTFFAEEVARPLGLTLALGRPGDLSPAARLLPAGPATVLGRQIPTALTRRNSDGRLFRRVLLKRSLVGRTVRNPDLGPRRFDVLNDADVQALELPWMNALATGSGLARLYTALAGDGSVDGVRLVRAEALRPVYARQSWSERDLVMHKPIGFSQGYVKDEPQVFTPSPRAFGHPGAGGALGWADPDLELAIGYVPNHMDWRIRSPRAMALCAAAVGVVRGSEPRTR